MRKHTQKKSAKATSRRKPLRRSVKSERTYKLADLMQPFSKSEIDEQLDQMAEAIKASKLLPASHLKEIDELSWFVAADLLAPKRQKQGRPRGSVSPTVQQRITLAAEFSRAGKNQREMAVQLFPDSREPYLDTRKFFSRYRAKITQQLDVSAATSH